MAAASVSDTRTRGTQTVESAKTTKGTRLASAAAVAPFAGLAMISGVQAWEWLFSGLTKLQNDAFIRGFLSFVSHAPGPYGKLMASLARSFGGFLPRLVEVTELGLGISLGLAALLVLVPRWRVRRLAILVAGAASIIGVVLAVNIAIIVGDRAPWRLGMAPFSTGIPVEALLAGISLAGVAEAYSAWRISRA